MNTASSSNNSNINPNYIEFQAGVTATLRSWSALRTAVEQSWGGSDSYSKAEDLRLNIYSNYHSSDSSSCSSSNKIMTQDELEDNLLLYMEDEFGVVLEDGSEVEVASNICQMYNECRLGNVELARKTVQIALQAEEQANLMASSQNNNSNTNLTMGGVKNIFLEEGGEATIDDDDEDDEDEDYVDGDDDNMEEDESDSSGDEEYDDDDDDDDNDCTRDANQKEEVDMQDVTTDNNNDGTDYITPSLASLLSSSSSLAQAYAAGSLFGGPTKPKKIEPPPRQLGEPEPEKAQPLVDEDGFAPVMTKKKKNKSTMNY
jgi:pre-rRNA-processing protein TSR2